MSFVNKDSLLLSFESICLLLLFLALLQWLEPPVKCWVEMVKVFFLLIPNPRGKHSVFHPLHDVVCRSFIQSIYKVEELLVC